MIRQGLRLKRFISIKAAGNIPGIGLLNRTIFGLLLFSAIIICGATFKKRVCVTIIPDDNALITGIIQHAIDSCSNSGGGVVRFPQGTFLAGGLKLRNNVTLQLDKGALLRGSDKYSDYTNDAFLFGKDLTDIRIEGEGVIDGVNCYNPKGEEGFRGPHCIRLINCKNISLQGVTIINSANWAINCRYCSDARITKVSIRGGHDGVHTRFCNNFTVTGCDVRTGDDAFAGNDNKDFIISDCKINSSCNGFRMGCYNFKVKHCTIWGPGEYIHKIQKRNNMLSAFVHFSPKDENPKQISGNWLIEDVTIDNVDNVYVYNYDNGLWQTGQPVTSVVFKKVKATGIINSFNISGDKDKQFSLLIKDSSFSYRILPADNKMMFEGVKFLSPALFNINKFGSLELDNVTIYNGGENQLLNCMSGNKVIVRKVMMISSEL